MPEARPQHPTLAIQAAGAADIGRTRSHNEDAILVRPDLRLWAVADGAGGHNAGNVASALAVTTVTNHFESTEREVRKAPDVDRFGLPVGARRLSAAVRKANRDIVDISKSSQRYGGMGSTIVAVTVAARSPTLYVAHVGDSRCYRLRAGRLEQLTHDHSLLNDLIEMHPDLGDDAILKLPRKVVTRALGMEETVRVTVRSFAIAADDVYLLCSDGLTGELPDEQIRRVLTLPEPPAELVERLIDMANRAGGGDNIAAVVLSCDVTAAPLGLDGETLLDRGHPQPPGLDGGHPHTPEPSVELAQLLEPDDEVPAPEVAAAPPPGRPPPRAEMMSAPEILLLGIESEVDPEEAAAIRVVPPESATSGLFRALGDLLPQRRGPPALPPTGAASSTCSTCAADLPAEGLFCPRCGMRRAGV
jgi:serine/threonine protein phosphatase PrpC